MRLRSISFALLAAAGTTAPAVAQQNAREQLRIYNQQTGQVARDERDWRTFRDYDFDRREAGQRKYYANRYYRDERYYQVHALGRDDRVYRGGDDRYYCRRADGTTGLIVHGITGRISSDTLHRGESSILGMLGSSLGKASDRGEVTCR